MASSSSNYGAMNAMEENIVSGVGVDENISLLHETNPQSSAEAAKAANMSSSGGSSSAAGGMTTIFGVQMPATVSLIIGVVGFVIVSVIVIVATTTNLFNPSSTTDTDDIV